MMHFTILSVGKMKKDCNRSIFEGYLKMINPYAKVEVIELGAESFGNSDQFRAKTKEGERIKDFLGKNKEAFVIILDEKGKEFSSQELALFLEKNSHLHIIFIIGGTLGFSEELKNSRYLKIALSRMTFPHEMARIILLEQLYRSISIIKGKKYHY